MRINVLLPTGTRTVDLDELKELARQGVVQPSTLLETGGQRGKAKNVPALKPIFAELAAEHTPTHTQTPQTSNPEPPAAPSETPDFVAVLRAVGQKNAPPQPLVDDKNANSDAGTVEDEGLYAISLDDAPSPSQPLDFSTLETSQAEEFAFPPIQTPNAATSFEPRRNPEASPNAAAPQFPPISPQSNSFANQSAAVFPRVAPASSGKTLKAIRAAKLDYWVKWGRGFLAVFDVLFVISALLYFVRVVFPTIADVFRAFDSPFYKEALLLCGSTFLGLLLAAFGYGLATILFRILFAASALYAASCEEEARNGR